MFFSIYTLGCKLNQLESEAIADSFRRAGFPVFSPNSRSAPDTGGRGDGLPGGSGIIVINSCTVTSMAEQKARRMIRKLLRDYPEACLIITGCYAQLDSAALTKLETHPSGRLFVLPGSIKDRIMDLSAFLSGGDNSYDSDALPVIIASWLGTQRERAALKAEVPVEASTEKPAEVSAGMPLEAPAAIPVKNAFHPNYADGTFRFKPEKFSFHSRGFIKIQDGCDRRCAYCRVSLARGKSRSLEAGKILSELLSMEQNLIPEAVLTGVNICQYRALEGEQLLTLPGLLDYLLKGTSRMRLRLSSIEPEELSPAFLKAISAKRIRPHFHLSVQSGSENVLERMNRPYIPMDVERAVKDIRSVRDDPFLACDIIVGFPGESEEEFGKTLRFCESIGFSWIHVFPFSRRPGTAAFNFTNRVSEKEAARRAELLSCLARKGRLEYLGRWEGREVEAVVEAGRGAGASSAAAVSENYLKLLVSFNKGTPLRPGSLIRCRVGKTTADLSQSNGFDALAEYLEPIS